MDDWDWERMRRRCVIDARGCGLAAADAEDAAQEALLRAWRRRKQCRTPDAPEAWVRAIGRREAIRLQTARRDEPTPLETLAAATVPDFAPAVEMRVDVARAFDVLSRRDRTLLAARYMLALGQTEIAHIYAVPGGTAAIRLNRARRRLRVALADEHEQEAN